MIDHLLTITLEEKQCGINSYMMLLKLLLIKCKEFIDRIGQMSKSW